MRHVPMIQRTVTPIATKHRAVGAVITAIFENDKGVEDIDDYRQDDRSHHGHKDGVDDLLVASLHCCIARGQMRVEKLLIVVSQ